MKHFDNFKLSIKNLRHNFSRTILTTILLTIILTITTSLTIFLYSAQSSTNDALIDNLKQPIKLSIERDNSSSLSTQEIKTFIDNAEKIMDIEDYSYQIKYTMYIPPAISDGNYENLIDEIENQPKYDWQPIIKSIDNSEMVEGRVPTKEDRDTNNIWLSAENANLLNLKVGDSIDFMLKTENDYGIVKCTIKGITKKNNYRDIKFFNFSKVELIDNTPSNYKLSYYKQLRATGKGLSSETRLEGATLNYLINCELALFEVYIIFPFMILLCLAFSIFSVLSAVKISIMGNSFLGILSSLGMKNKNIVEYVIYQIFVLLAFATVVSTIFAIIISKLTFKVPLVAIIRLQSATIEYNILISIANFAILGLFIIGFSAISLKKFLDKKLYLV